ncbi:Hypothetical_protein [Hexamita inflata]|uniref:Hypothetical_protein n=1 Tax=Hexamita inflata TaxID=28002 RepID=A0AA86R1L1_9EUKA|nr:Hypothetical protein HINF_LOCUS57649 [Hexamita inflata]
MIKTIFTLTYGSSISSSFKPNLSRFSCFCGIQFYGGKRRNTIFESVLFIVLQMLITSSKIDFFEPLSLTNNKAEVQRFKFQSLCVPIGLFSFDFNPYWPHLT